MTWWEAARRARSGARVRRAAWSHRWIEFRRGLFWIVPFNAVTRAESRPHVVLAHEFHSSDFIAMDWTLEPMPVLPPGAFPPFDIALIRYRWTPEDGADLDTLTSLSGTGNPLLDDLPVGFAGAASLAPWLRWAGDNTASFGVECVAVDFRQLAIDFPLASELRVAMRCYWFGTRQAGEVELEIETFHGGAIIPTSDNDYACDGEPANLATTSYSITRRAEDSNPALLGDLIYDPSSREAVIEEGGT